MNAVLNQKVRPGHLIVRRCGKIEYLFLERSGSFYSFDIDTHEVYEITNEVLNNGKHKDSRSLDIIKILESQIDYYEDDYIWIKTEQEKTSLDDLIQTFVKQYNQEHGVEETIRFLSAAGIGAAEMVNRFKISDSVIKEHFNRKFNYYDLVGAFWIIQDLKDDIDEAFLYIKEDPFFTRVKIYDFGKGYIPILGKNANLKLSEALSAKDTIVSGISGSEWGTPALKIKFKSGRVNHYNITE